MNSNWPTHNQRRVFFDMHLPDWTRPGQSGGAIDAPQGVATRFDVEETIAQFARAHVNWVVFFAKCQYGNFYYDTQIGHKHSGLGDLDLLGRFVKAAHKHGIRALAYYSNAWDVEVARAHPEWMMRDADGQTSYKRWPRVCLNSPYRELVHAHLREILGQYDVDGLWMDMLHVLPCYCPRCQALYEQRFDRPMPRRKEGRAWLDLVHFQYDYLYDYIAQARAIAKELRPEAVFMFNHFGSPYAPPSNGLDATRQLSLSDCASTEGYSEWHGLQFPSYAARLMRAVTRSGAYEVLTSRFVRTWDFTLRPTEQMKFEAFSIAANGGAVCVDDSPYHDGRVEPRVYDRLAEVYAEIKAREPWLMGSQPTFYAGLYHSLKTREVAEMLAEGDHDGEDEGFYGFYPEQLEALADPVLSLQGAFKAMIEGHLPTEFVYEQGVTAEELARYRVIYLPNIVAMDENEAALLRAYVTAGGGLVATGATSLLDEWGERRPNFMLADLFGLDYVRRSPYSFAYLRFDQDTFLPEMGDAPLPHYRPMLEVQPNRPVDVIATLVEPIIQPSDEVYYHNNQPAPYHVTGVPAVIKTRAGHGRVVYISGEPETNYAVLGHAPYRRLILESLRWAAGDPPEIVPHVPTNTEVTYRCLGDARVLHLLTCWPQKSVTFDDSRRTAESMEESYPIYNVRIDVPPATRSATLVPDGQTLSIHREDEHAWIIVPKLRLWETLVLETETRRGTQGGDATSEG